MSIEVQNISKNYGEQKALDAVSFSVKKGEIVGFLGPNGAGKSTLLAVLATVIRPTFGRVAQPHRPATRLIRNTQENWHGYRSSGSRRVVHGV